MTDLDLDRLGDVWRQQPDAAEMDRLQRSAAAVSRRARLGRVIDTVAAAVVAAVVIFLVLSNPKIGTVLIGSAAIIVLLGTNIRQRRVRQIELRSLTGSTEDMLDQSIDRIETTLKHNRLSLLTGGPALLVGILLAATAERGSLFSAFRDIQLSRVVWSGLIIAVLVVGAAALILAIRRGTRELGRLRAMREAYRHERDSTTP